MPKGVYPHRVMRHAVTQPLDDSYRLIPLTQGQNAIVDVEDFEALSKFNWYANWSDLIQSYYAIRSAPYRTSIKMHRQILGCKEGDKVDHKNHNTLDNRRANLRIVSYSQSGANRRRQRNNTSGYKGVYWNKQSRKWQSVIRWKNRRTSLGYFHSSEEAARAYDKAAKIRHGEFASLNFPA